jgi:hypothetical protein
MNSKEDTLGFFWNPTRNSGLLMLPMMGSGARHFNGGEVKRR